MPLPREIEKLMQSAAEQVADLKAQAERERAEKAERKRRAAEEKRRESERVLPLATEIERWLQGPDAARLDALRKAACLREVLLLGPVREDGTDADGHSGSVWIHLKPGPALSWNQRTGPAWGNGGGLRTAAEIAEKLTGPVVDRLTRDIHGGAIWKAVERDIAQEMQRRREVLVEFVVDDLRDE